MLLELLDTLTPLDLAVGAVWLTAPILIVAWVAALGAGWVHRTASRYGGRRLVGREGARGWRHVGPS